MKNKPQKKPMMEKYLIITIAIFGFISFHVMPLHALGVGLYTTDPAERGYQSA
jgi:hypothetical protein